MMRSLFATPLSNLILLCFSVAVLTAPLQNVSTIDHRNPVIVIIPEIWHVPRHYFNLQQGLHDAGYSTISQQLQTTGARRAQAGQDANYIRQKILKPLLDGGEKVILLMHGYGAIPGSAAAKGLSVAERESASLSGGVAGLIYISGMMARQGESYIDKLPGQSFPSWMIQRDDGRVVASDPYHILYNDTPDSVAVRASLDLLPQSRASLISTAGAPAWADKSFDNRRAYYACTDDRVVFISSQLGMVQSTKVPFILRKGVTDHSPMLSKVEDLGDWVIKIASTWEGKYSPQNNGTSTSSSIGIVPVNGSDSSQAPSVGPIEPTS